MDCRWERGIDCRVESIALKSSSLLWTYCVLSLEFSQSVALNQSIKVHSLEGESAGA